MIKQKRHLSQGKTSFINSQLEFFINHFTPSFEDERSRQVYKDARRRLEIMQDANRNSAIKENVDPSKKKQPDLANQQLGFISQENLFPTRAASSTAQESASDKKKDLTLFLKEMVDFRIKNQLIYGYKEGVDSSTKQWGVGASKTAGYYLRNLESTITREERGWCEFIITYDNKIILNDKIAEDSLKLNHLSMGCGTLLKAAGRLKIENGKLTIWSSSQYLELGATNINIIFFALLTEGFPIENIDIFDEKRGSVSCTDYYTAYGSLSSLGECFPLAKASAENKKVSIASSLSELCLGIDDEILSTRGQELIRSMNISRNELKKDIIELFLLMTEAILNQKDIEINGEMAPKTAASQAIFQCYKKIEEAIQVFKVRNIDFSFINKEIFSWFFYLKQLQFQMSELVVEADKKLLREELVEIERSLKEIKVSSAIPQRFKESHEVSKPFIKFYNEDPLKSCIRLLYDYTKGGFIKRFLSGAWNRHHVQAVNRFLKKYEMHQLADNHSIQAIYQELFGVTNRLNEYTGKRGTLYARLLFCAALANEIPVESPNLVSVAMEEINETSNGDIQEREHIADSMPLPVPSGTPSGVLLKNSPIESPQHRSSPRSNENSTFFKPTKSESVSSSEILNRDNSPTESSSLSFTHQGTP